MVGAAFNMAETKELSKQSSGDVGRAHAYPFKNETVESLVDTLEQLGFYQVRELDPMAGQALFVAAAALEKRKAKSKAMI